MPISVSIISPHCSAEAGIAMTGSYIYRDWVGAALGIPQYSYVQDYLVYCGTYGSPVYGKLSSGEKEKIRLLCESYGLPI